MTGSRLTALVLATGLAIGLAQACALADPVEPNPPRSKQGAGGGQFVKPDDETLKKTLSPIQFHVTQEDGTERPFRNEYWDNKVAGLYVDVVSGEPLFASVHKYDSGTGWPSFWTTVDPENVVEKKDRKLFMTRTEVRSRQGDSHLGHVFPDGPAPTGQRYCVNSAALRFVPIDQLEAEGYGKYLALFDEPESAETGE